MIVASNSLTVSNVYDGTITHTAYANSADGTDGFTTFYPKTNLLNGTKVHDILKGTGTANAGGTQRYTLDKSLKISDLKLSRYQDLIFEFDWKATGTNPSGYFLYQTQTYYKGTGITITPTNTSGHVKNTFFNLPVTTDMSTFITARQDNIPTTVTVEISNLMMYIVDYSPWMPSASEVTTADWPSYIGQYTDFTQADSTNPSDYTWSLIRGNDGKDGATGNDGIAGKDGTGIKTTTITYAGSTSGTTAPTSGWTSTVPTVAAGSYLWTKTVWAYTDNSFETGYSVGKMGNTGPAGSNGDPGKVIQQNTEPTNKFLDMLWQYTGTEPLNATGITVLSNIIYVWNGTAWQIWLLNPQNIQAVNAWITNAMIGNAAIKLANIDTATITELSAVTATLGDVESGSITNDISYGFVAQGNHQYLGNSVINYRGINISETATLDNVLQYTQSMGFDAITGLFFQRLNENQDIISNIRLIEIGNNEMGLYVSNATESATLTSKGLTLSTDVPWTSLTPTGGFNGGSIQFSVQNGVAYFSVSALGVPAMTANIWYQCAQLPTGSSAIPSANKVTTALGNDSVWGFYVSRSGGLFFQCKSNVSATGNLANALAAFPIG